LSLAVCRTTTTTTNTTQGLAQDISGRDQDVGLISQDETEMRRLNFETFAGLET